jgi:outer membrane protein assembly factor BamB
MRGLAARSGNLRWETSYDQPVGGSPYAGSTLVFISRAPVSEDDGRSVARLDAFDRATGTPRWTFEVSDETDSFAGALGVVNSDRRSTLVHTDPGTYRVLDTNDGTERFSFATFNDDDRPAVVGGSVVYIVGASLTATDTESGMSAWSIDAPEQRIIALSDEDDAVYLSNRRSGPSATMTAVDARRGTQRWTVETGLPSSAVRGAGGGIILLQSPAHVVAIDAKNGSERWRVPLATNGLTLVPSFAKGMVVLGVGSDLLCR